MNICLICNERFFAAKKFKARNNYYYLSCLSCSGGLLMPRQKALKELKQAYSKEYFDWKEADGFRKYFNKLQFFTDYPDWIESVYSRKQKKLLDVGAGIPDFVLKMKKRGWNCFALEISKDQVNLIKKYLAKDHVWQGDFEKKIIKSNTFDLVTFWHMLEHLNNPFESIKKVARLLKPEGMVFAEFPNFDSLNLRLFGENYCYFDLPGHLVYYNKKSLAKLFEKNGFVGIEISYPLKLNGSFSLNLFNLVTKKTNSDLLGISIFYLSMPISLLLSVINSLTGKTDLMRISARKK